MDELYRWSRWILLSVTSPSGKMLFVCRFCGHTTPLPSHSCPPIEDNGETVRHMYGLKCDEFEKLIIDIRKKRLSEHHRLLYAENALKPIQKRWCDACYGWGCQTCVGSGLMTFSIEDLMREVSFTHQP